MNPQNGNGWPPVAGGGAPPAINEHVIGQQRQPGTFGPTQPQTLHQAPPTQMNGSSLLQQSGPFFPNGHSLPNSQSMPPLASIQSAHGPPAPQRQQSPPGIPNHPVQPPGYALPTLGPSLQQRHSPQAAMAMEREIERDRLAELQKHHENSHRQYNEELERSNQQREQQQREQLQREQLQREQLQRQQLQHEQLQLEQLHLEQLHRETLQQREQQQREQLQSPRENHTAAIPIQQPVASRVPATLHGPNGILNDQHPGVGAAPSQALNVLGAPNGPSNVYGNGVQTPNDNSLRPFVPQVAPLQQSLGFNNSATPQQLSTGIGALSQGQQPILNDALSYLDQVKVRFVHQPDVYNQFLDIMKDFKSQAIDTPGVIDRVSSLFAGHPELIQGFNTFLPPGYRIECGTRDDPNAIRVTTPMGTTVSQMPTIQHRANGVANGALAMENSRQTIYADGAQANGEWPAPQHEEDDVGAALSNARSGGHPLFAGQANLGSETRTTYGGDEQGEAAMIAHQQEQQGVSHLSNAVSAVATNGAQGRHPMAQISPGGGQVTSLGQAAVGLNNSALTASSQLGLEKRGPVEFNHAIGYVNKIKNRFATQPEIYKQFLEILQTYQRESKPIQDVYAQVTQLFSSAPDLLEDFKQFLPESAAQAKAQAAAKQASEDAAMLSNVRGDSGYGTGLQQAQVQTPRPDIKMPPVGNFAPPSATKENKKRRGGPGSQMTGGASAVDAGAGPSGLNNRNGGARGNANKRTKFDQAKPTVPEMPPVSPTLVPSLPTPMPPSKDLGDSLDQFAFFDRVRKFISDKKTYNEFLKLCNLFTQELIDKNVLVHKVHGFIGGNADLMSYFKGFVRYDGRDEIVENKPKIPGDKVVLSNCRGLGPSYRMLPKRERLRVCSGRDEMCQQVLNDEWVSHPTWASEDSGFIAHRKNIFEESLHRIEEERHDYDINIEACSRTIQLLEPIAQQLSMMAPEERPNFSLKPGIGGQSETIYQRVIKKIYDRERGKRVINDLFRRPDCVVPVLLGRLKMKCEEWKASQREWEKVWREQTNKIFYKSLDHQGIIGKAADKRQFQTKQLQTEIHVRWEEQRRQRIAPWDSVPNYQFKYTFDDLDVVHDACHLILTQLQYGPIANETDKTRLETFVKTFVPTFFGIDRDSFQARMSDIYDATPSNEEVEDENGTNEDSGIVRGRKAAGGRKSNLLRGVLERGRLGQKEDSVLESKETTPDVSNDEDTPASSGTPTDRPARVDEAEYRWLNVASTGDKSKDYNVPYKRDDFNLYASLNIYCFMRMFDILYQRLFNLKLNEKKVQEDVQRSLVAKAANDLRLVEKTPSDFFSDVSPSANYYGQMVGMFEEVMKSELDHSQLEEALRRFYIGSGWQLYNFDKVLAALIRYALTILVSDNKDKSLDIINLFYKDRKEDETNHNTELTYRKRVQGLVREGDMYRIRYNRISKQVLVSLFKREEKTYQADELAVHQRWSYYISTYSMRDQTEGVRLSDIQLPFLKRNMPPMLADEEEYNNTYGIPQWNYDGLVIMIQPPAHPPNSPRAYKLLYEEDTSDWWVHNNSVRKRGLGAYGEVVKERKEKFNAMFGAKGTFIEAKSGSDLDKENEGFQRWIQDGPAVQPRPEAGQDEAHDVDEVMGGT